VITRRGIIGIGAGAMLAGCDRLSADPDVRGALAEADGVHRMAQRLLGREALAREFSPAQMSPVFRSNGNVDAQDAGWRAAAARGFDGWALQVGGLVHRPLALPLVALQTMPQKSQITRHDCVEGWSAIGKWQGPRLGAILSAAGLLPAAKYVVFHCADRFGDAPYYESIDLVDAFHPQTILAWRMNDAPLSVEHGAPLRLRVERQLGYKQAKFIMRIEVRDTLAGLYGGKGGYWEDAADYHWFAGI
jgi:DMSO/TMAO reductase YedYZ molybdopterin-dependent catalytic subunit